MKCGFEWKSPPPAEMTAGQAAIVRVRVTNLGDSRWSSVGGFFNSGAVLIRAAWSASDHPLTAGASSHWLAWKLDPGRAFERAIQVIPPSSGRLRLDVGLEQDRIGPFPPQLCRDLQAEVVVRESNITLAPRRP
jgi:hypothetical protein